MTYEYDHALMFRVRFDQNPEEWLWDWMQGWLDDWNDWADASHGPNELPTLREPIEDGQDPYYAESFWFSWAHDRAAIFDPLIEPPDSNQEGTLEDACSWARVGYHDCTHPGGGGPCNWDEQREHGIVPDYITDMSPE